MRFVKYILIFVLLSLIITCKKYPDDSKFHLSTVKNRLAGGVFIKSKRWDNGGALRLSNNSIALGSGLGEPIDFYRNGDFHGYLGPYFAFDGTWEFIDKKDKLKITNNNGVISEYTIMKLDNNELWF